jgi:hypothetical protein
MFINQLSLLTNPRRPSNTRPIRRRVIIKTNIDMRVVLDFIEFMTCFVPEEHEMEWGLG